MTGKVPHPTITRILEILFILNAEHEITSNTAMMRHLVSSGVDVYSAIAGSIAAFGGLLQGASNIAVFDMLNEIKNAEGVEAYLANAKKNKKTLPGFGSPIWKNYDPRARTISKYL